MYLHANFEFIMILNIHVLVGNLEDGYIQPVYVY